MAIARKYNFAAATTISSSQMNEELNQLVTAANDRYTKTESDDRYVKKETTNWVNVPYSSNWKTADYVLQSSLGDDNIVYIRGVIKNGSTSINTTVGILPSGHTPPKNCLFVAYQSNVGVIPMTITTTGAIVLSAGFANSTDPLHINTSFRI